MALVPFDSVQADKSYQEFYNQTGGMMPVFAGAKYQRGHGIGNVISGLFKAALPMVKKGISTIGKSMLKTGLRTAQDALTGKDVKTSFVSNIKDEGKNMLDQSVNYLLTPNTSNKSRKRKRRPVRSHSAAKRRRTKQPTDIFS